MHGLLTTFLDTTDGAAKVMAHAQLLLRLSRRFEALLPAGLARVARVANLKSGKVIIHAENGAAATKIRQMSQRLCNELSKDGAQFSGLEVKVQPRQIPHQSMTSTLKPLSPKALKAISGGAEILPPGALRGALEHLLKHAATQE